MDIWAFWIVAIAVSMTIFSLLLRKLFGDEMTKEGPQDTDVFRDQLAEVDRDIARGVVDAGEAARIRTEISRRLLAADAVAQNTIARFAAAKAAPARLSKNIQSVVAGLFVVFAMTGAVFLYQYLGVPGYADLPLVQRLSQAQQIYENRPAQEQAEAPAPQTQVAQSEVAQSEVAQSEVAQSEVAQIDPETEMLMTKLRNVLAKNPDDIEGLALLARNEAALGNYIAARKAYEHRLDLLGENATREDHLDLAQTMIVAAGGYVSPQAEEQLIKTLALAPDDGLARYFSGLMFAQTGRPDRAFDLWQALLVEGPYDAPWTAPIRSGIEELAYRAGVKYALPDAPKGPTSQDLIAAQDMAPQDQQQMIEGMVLQLEDRLNADGGPVEEWVKLINAIGVLKQPDRAKAAYDRAVGIFAGDAAALATLRDVAAAAGVAP